ncbi:hypothetical protein E0Z10_g4582 [Xylaria hypoxylon]|uniref:N-acetyltransferase domain-containing protein n=1 Tax=Xylaria hypoxylon TaxID=37992 RepID=A0A4Z0YYD1_9PEZI|nr:hypothetical protein E0Z10_g4582 [Xylaria hypoxylon]
MSKIIVAVVEDEDVPKCFQVMSESFGHNAPFVDSYFPNHDTSFGQIQGSQRLTAWKNTSESSAFLKAVLSNNIGEELIIGFAVWTHMKDLPPAELENAENVEEVWPNEEDREFTAQLWRDYVKPRTQAVKDSGERGVYVLELLAVHPGHWRLGAGTALVKWGTRAADGLGIRAIVEGTPAGRPLYEKCGLLVEIEEMRFDIGEDFAARAKPKLSFMTREPGV